MSAKIRLPQAASTLADAYNALDPDALCQGSDLEHFYVTRPGKRTVRLGVALRQSKDHAKFLFIGHRGGGKSTELQALSGKLTDAFRVFDVPIYSVFQSGSLSYEEFLFAVYTRVAAQAIKDKLVGHGIAKKVWDDHLVATTRRLHKLLFGPSATLELDVSATATVSAWFLEIETKVGTDASLRERLQGHASELLEALNRLLAEIKQADRKLRVLLVVEDLDKFDLTSSASLFYEHAQTLLGIHAHAIYTFPVAMRFDDRFQGVKQAFDPFFLANVATSHRDGKPDEDGRAFLRSVLTKRIHASLLEEGVLDYLVMRGGVVRDVIKLARNAALNSLGDGSAKISLGHAEESFRDAVRERQSLLRAEDYTLLRDAIGQPVVNSEQYQRLLFNGSLLEYENTVGNWWSPSPDARHLLDASPAADSGS